MKAKTKKYVRLANDFIRPSPFQIIKKKDEALDEKKIYHYGNVAVIVSGQLYEEDRGTLMCLLAIAKRNNHKPFDFTLTQIAIEKGVKNPYQKTTLTPIRQSVERLLDAQIRIRSKNKELTGKFSFIEGWLKGNAGNLSVSPYLDIVRDLTLGTTLISLSTYFSLKSQIARSLYSFLVSHRNFYIDKGYVIRLSRLTRYINFETSERQWWRVWEQVAPAIEELKKNKILSRYKYDKKRCKDEGGILTFHSVKKKKPALSEGDQNTEIIKNIKDELKRKVVNWSDSDDKAIRIELNKASKFLEQYHHSLNSFIRDYCYWLNNSNDLSYFSTKLFNPDNGFFKAFVKYLDEDRRLDRQPQETSFIVRQPTEQQNKEMEQIRSFRKSHKCPHGHKDLKWEEYGECIKCIAWDECQKISK